MQTIHFFRSGQHVTSTGQALAFSEGDLAAIAAAYDPKTHEAPIVVGHPKTDAPAYGWIEKIIAKADGLHAVTRQVNHEFAELVRQGAYKKVSPGFYPANAKNNPKPGVPYLRHLGFLGAEPPAVKGLSPIEFSEGEEMFFMEQDLLALREHSVNAREKAHERRIAGEAILTIQRQGRFPIGLLPGVLAFNESLSDGETIEFSEDGGDVVTNSQSAFFVDFLAKLPMPVALGELANADLFSEAEAAFEGPKGYEVKKRSAAVLKTAQGLMKSKGLTLANAVKEAEATVPHD